MKRILILILLVLCFPLSSFADEMDEVLPMNSPARLTESAKQVIRLGVDKNAAIEMTRIMVKNRFREEQMIKAYDIVLNAEQQNLPLEPVIDKLHEGVAKHVETDNIIRAMEKVRSRYETANKYARRLSSNKDLVHRITGDMAECIAAGMDTGDIGRITDMLKQKNSEMVRDRSAELSRETFRLAKIMALMGSKSNNKRVMELKK